MPGSLRADITSNAIDKVSITFLIDLILMFTTHLTLGINMGFGLGKFESCVVKSEVNVIYYLFEFE